jgi:hypothetical protein
MTLGKMTIEATMEKPKLSNWQKVEKLLRQAGKTDTPFYKRAVEILNGGADPTNFNKPSSGDIKIKE